ncbi:response regulator [Ensifer soli]|uniref:response regulator n=1 Tax=Ciceribacter sp. sgz301302 TaxID=3342379 RepID=UPI0035B70E31
MPGYVQSEWQKTTQHVLIVEDELLIALDLEDIVSHSEAGAEVIGYANRMPEALRLGHAADIAFVDVNLADGPTGPEIGRRLAKAGVSVIFMTANPEAVDPDEPGILGVLTKPVRADCVEQALVYAAAKRRQKLAVVPNGLRAFG